MQITLKVHIRGYEMNVPKLNSEDKYSSFSLK